MLTRLSSKGTSTVAPGSPKGLQRLQNYLTAFLWPGTSQRHQRKSSTQMDAMDSFTTQLVRRKSQEWEELCDTLTTPSPEKSVNGGRSFEHKVGLLSKAVVNDLQQLRSPQLGLDIRTLSQAQLDNLLLATLEIRNKVDFLYLIRQCIQWQQLPSNEVLVSCLKYLSTLGLVPQLEALSETCRETNHPFVTIYSDLAPFKGIALWKSGNADGAIKTLYSNYAASLKSEEGRRMMRNAFRTVAELTLLQKPEAVLNKLMDVAREIHREHNDVFVVACVWRYCFSSGWYSDQQIAEELFEQHKDLQQLVERRATALTSSFLNGYNVNAVHRLIELLLEYRQLVACSSCLNMLFDHQYLEKDLNACAEIVKCCNALKMPLSESQNTQFLNLFLDYNDILYSKHIPSQPSTLPKPKSFQYKF